MGELPTSWPRDPAFDLGASARLDPAADTDPLAAWRLCSSLVIRDPLDLEAHTRRVLLACTPALADRADGVLIDLFVALGAQGPGLRRRLLAIAAPVLSPALRGELESRLTRASGEALVWAMCPGRVLGQAVPGHTELVSRERSERAAETPLQQAVALLDEGQLDAARQVLEDALLEAPDDTDLLRELQGIYHHLRDPAVAVEMAHRLQARHARLPAGWDAAP